MSLIGSFQLYSRTALLIYDFLILRLHLIDDSDVNSEKKNFFVDLSGDFYLLSLLDSKVFVLLLYLILKNVTVFRKISFKIRFCSAMIVFLQVCLLDLIYHNVCQCGVITRSYLSFST